jgi:2-oxoglutarate/2-oxoacid ferredoxin oxidoreductase subunit beta
MEPRDLITPAANTWCAGCGNFGIEHGLKEIVAGLVADGTPLEQIVLVTGIGCHGKMADYLGINSFYSIHGRTLPVATGLKLANPELTVIVCAGDGDCYGEGLEHLLFAAKRNVDLTLLVHDNRVYALTTGQYTPTSPLGFPGRSTPQGTPEYPLNPVELMIAAGATWVGRGYTRRLPQLRELIRAAIGHRGFSVLEILQISTTYYNQFKFYDEHVYDLEAGTFPTADLDTALRAAREYDYSRESRIPLGVFYETTFPTFEERLAEQRAKKSDPVGVMQRLMAERT